MGLTVVTSAASHHRIASARDWLNARRPGEEVLIIGSSLDGANEIARSVAQAKLASFGCHRLSLGQLASALARQMLTAQRTVPLGPLGIQAITNRVIQTLVETGGLGRYSTLKSGPGLARAVAKVVTELRLEQVEAHALARVAPDLEHVPPELTR
jgi:hypothetical protein